MTLRHDYTPPQQPARLPLQDEVEQAERDLNAAVESADVEAAAALLPRLEALRLIQARLVEKAAAAVAANAERNRKAYEAREMADTPERVAARRLEALRPAILEAQEECRRTDNAPYAVAKLRGLTNEHARLTKVVS